ncbi:MAG: eukaryotic-like serine/threonine-protein kinase, partial [Abditibacteriota bacterium]|nr:eukaryotic-like serine/threonine-protein kinase [Abditibacteriota bacterium]
MPRMLRGLLAVGLMAALLNNSGESTWAQGATLVREGEAYRVRAPKYEAIVAADGALTNLRVGNSEFLRPGVGISRGSYFYQNGPLKLPSVAQAAPNVLTAKSDLAAIRYEFGADTMTWTVSNASDTAMNFFLVLDAAVRAGRNEAGAWAALPTTGQWNKANLFRDRTRLEVGGTTRVWGPWEANLQVLETALAPRETRAVTFRIADATNEEIAKATEIVGAAQKAANKAMEELDLTVLSPRP